MELSVIDSIFVEVLWRRLIRVVSYRAQQRLAASPHYGVHNAPFHMHFSLVSLSTHYHTLPSQHMQSFSRAR